MLQVSTGLLVSSGLLLSNELLNSTMLLNSIVLLDSNSAGQGCAAVKLNSADRRYGADEDYNGGSLSKH